MAIVEVTVLHCEMPRRGRVARLGFVFDDTTGVVLKVGMLSNTGYASFDFAQQLILSDLTTIDSVARGGEDMNLIGRTLLVTQQLSRRGEKITVRPNFRYRCLKLTPPDHPDLPRRLRRQMAGGVSLYYQNLPLYWVRMTERENVRRHAQGLPLLVVPPPTPYHG